MGMAVIKQVEGTTVEFDEKYIQSVNYGPLSEDWYVYKTKEKGFGVGKFTIFYDNE